MPEKEKATSILTTVTPPEPYEATMEIGRPCSCEQLVVAGESLLRLIYDNLGITQEKMAEHTREWMEGENADDKNKRRESDRNPRPGEEAEMDA